MENDQWKTVNGIDVVEVRSAKTPLYQENPDGTNNGSVYQKVVELVLADATSVFGCVWPGCLYTYDNPTTIATGHWKVHEVKPDLRRVPFKDWTLEEILGRVQDAESDLKLVMAQRDKALLRRGTGNQADKELIAELRKDLREANAKIRDYEKAFRVFGKLLPNAPQQ